MTRWLTPRRLVRALGASTLLLLLALAGGPADAAAAPAPWKAVLVAGDNAEPVFDNAVAAIAGWLAGLGVKPGDIHRFSASPPAHDPSVEPASARRVLQAIADLAARPGQRCLIFLTSHGKRDDGLYLAYRGEFLTPAELARALALGCAAAPSVVIVSSCYSGAFSEGAMQAATRIILTAARADRPSFGCAAGRTYTVFDECLLATLAHQRSWRATYRRNLLCVRRREKSLAVLPSRPQAFFGSAVRALAVR